jgi:hypothetical protein
VSDVSSEAFDPNAISPKIPGELHPAVMVARQQWQQMWPGMELDGTADLIVMALAHHGFLCSERRRPTGKQQRRSR